MEPSIKIADLEIFPETTCAKRNGEVVDLTLSEFKILLFLAKNPGFVYSKNKIYKHIFDTYPRHEADIIKVYISRIRKKLGANYIQPVKFAGYKFVENI